MINPGVQAVGAAQAGGAPQFASLYVGDLDPEVTEAMLYEIFNTVGPVASIRVCRDSVSRRSLGYAYVNFHSASDAERVMDTLNYSTIKGRCCRIMWSHRDPNLRKTGNGNVFVKNLDKNVDNKALYDTFSLFGNILSCKVAVDSDGKSRGYGFVHYETAEAAKQAIEKVNNMQIGEKTVYVGEFLPREGRTPAEVVNFTNIYVKNYPKEWSEEELLTKFKEFGEITSSMVQKDKKERGFAFLNYATAEAAQGAIKDMHRKDIRSDEEKVAAPNGRDPKGQPIDEKDAEEAGDGEGKKKISVSSNPEDEENTHPDHLLFVSRAMTKSEREQMLKAKFRSSVTGQPVGVNLYIKNLPDDCDDDQLRQMFEPFGGITSARVMQDTNKRSKGFGFVCYKTPDEATKAVSDMHLKTIKGKPLYVGLAEKKDERTSRLAQRYKGEKGSAMMTQGKGVYDPNQQMGQQPQMMGGKGMNPMMQAKGMQYPQYPTQQMMQQGGKMGMMANQQMMRPQQQMQMAPQPQMNPNQQRMGMMQPPAAYGMQGQVPGMMGKGGAPLPMMQQQMMLQQQKGMPMQMQQQMGMPQKGGQQQNQIMTQQRNVAPQAQQLTAQALASAPPGMQKQMLGEKLYPAVSRLQPELAGKITGMMLEMENTEVLMMLESEVQLRQKVDEAVRVLNNIK